jgi:hypothetical protein
MGDFVRVVIIAIGLPLVFIALLSWLLHYFVALKSPPTERAAWTVGAAYLIVSILGLFGGPDEFWWGAPLAAIPAGLFVFWWWRRDFQQVWIDDAQPVPEDVDPANDDWRIGIIFVGGLLGIFALRVLWRLAAQL